jgi:nicotinate-nucleotide adenylyltransferase
MRVALFGGSFDPPHLGHVLAMAHALSTARVERLMMVPCFRHAFDKTLSPFAHRLAMATLAAQVFGERARASDIEATLGGPSRTLVTVKALLAQSPEMQITLVVGSDLVGERERWYGYAELASLVEFAVVPRAGHEAQAPFAIPDVSSTEIRARIAAGRSIAHLVPAAVADYIAAHGLYRDAPTGGEGGG